MSFCPNDKPRHRWRGNSDDLHTAKLDARTHFILVGETRPPRRGEWYLSGAIPCAYRAKNNLSASYTIVRPTLRGEDTLHYMGPY